MTLDAESKKVWAGLIQPNADRSAIAEDIRRLEEHVGEYDAFQALTDGEDNFADLQAALEAEGFDAEHAESFVNRIQQNYETYDEFNTFVQEQNSYQGFQNGFGTNLSFGLDSLDEGGNPLAGMRIHETEGMSYNGVPLPAGTVEIYGRRVEFSQSGPPADPSERLVYSNLQVTNDTPPVGAGITVSCDVFNQDTREVWERTVLLVDGSVEARQSVTIPPQETKEVSFFINRSQYVCHDITIEDLPAQTVCWVPPRF